MGISTVGLALPSRDWVGQIYFQVDSKACSKDYIFILSTVSKSSEEERKITLLAN